MTKSLSIPVEEEDEKAKDGQKHNEAERESETNNEKLAGINLRKRNIVKKENFLSGNDVKGFTKVEKDTKERRSNAGGVQSKPLGNESCKTEETQGRATKS